MATRWTHTEDLAQGDPNSPVCADWVPSSLMFLRRRSYYSLTKESWTIVAVVLYVLETYFVLHMRSDCFFKCRSLNQQDKTIQTNTSGRSTMYHCSSKFFNTLETTKEKCKCLLKEKMFNMERKIVQSSSTRRNTTVRTMFINDSTTLLVRCVTICLVTKLITITGNDVAKQVFSKKTYNRETDSSDIPEMSASRYIISSFVLYSSSPLVLFTVCFFPHCAIWIRWCRCGGSRWLQRHSCTWGTSSVWCRNASSDIRSRTRGNTLWAPSPCLVCCSRGTAALPGDRQIHCIRANMPTLTTFLFIIRYHSSGCDFFYIPKAQSGHNICRGLSSLSRSYSQMSNCPCRPVKQVTKL